MPMGKLSLIGNNRFLLRKRHVRRPRRIKDPKVRFNSSPATNQSVEADHDVCHDRFGYQLLSAVLPMVIINLNDWTRPIQRRRWS